MHASVVEVEVEAGCIILDDTSWKPIAYNHHYLLEGGGGYRLQAPIVGSG